MQSWHLSMRETGEEGGREDEGGGVRTGPRESEREVRGKGVSEDDDVNGKLNGPLPVMGKVCLLVD